MKFRDTVGKCTLVLKGTPTEIKEVLRFLYNKKEPEHKETVGEKLAKAVK